MADGATVSVWTHPGSGRRAVAWDRWRNRWEVWVEAPARDGRANRELVELIAGWLEVEPARVRIRSGAAHRAKSLDVEGLSDPAVTERLRRAASARGTGGRRTA